jgi:alpha-1,2-glucosyltransferase
MDSVLVLGSALVVNWYHSEPYMDEIFHVRQLGKYLEGDFASWDQKITTLPGLYFLTYAVLKVIPLHNILPLVQVCRLFNASIIFPIFIILKKYSPCTEKLILLYPPLFMSSVLFYTDTVSLLTILLVYICILQQRKLFGFVLGLFSILCRQTNVVWVAYFVGKNIITQYNVNTFGDIIKVFQNMKKVVSDYWPYLLVILCFCGFVVVNKGITVGDKEDHEPGLHFAQIPYLFLLISIIIPLDTAYLKRTLLSKSWALCLPFFYLIISNFTYAHRYLVGDNTHYTFHIWKRILSPYGLFFTPLYSISYFYIAREQNIAFFFWLCCSSAVLVPATLLEPRYFIIPLAAFLFNQQLEVGTLRIWALRIANLATIAIFALRPHDNRAYMW